MRNRPFGTPTGAGKPFEKILPVYVIDEDRGPFDSTNDDMMQSTGGMDARLAGHALKYRIGCDKTTMKQRPPASALHGLTRRSMSIRLLKTRAGPSARARGNSFRNYIQDHGN
jgi:hypothetical protein